MSVSGRAIGRVRVRASAPLSVQIVALLIGGLIMAQLATLALTLLWPPAPPPQYGLADIAAALKGAQIQGRRDRPLVRTVRNEPPSLRSAGWLVSERSRHDLARLLDVPEPDVRLLFYSPLPFAGAERLGLAQLGSELSTRLTQPVAFETYGGIRLVEAAYRPPGPGAPPGGAPPSGFGRGRGGLGDGRFPDRGADGDPSSSPAPWVANALARSGSAAAPNFTPGFGQNGPASPTLVTPRGLSAGRSAATETGAPFPGLLGAEPGGRGIYGPTLAGAPAMADRPIGPPVTSDDSITTPNDSKAPEASAQTVTPYPAAPASPARSSFQGDRGARAASGPSAPAARPDDLADRVAALGLIAPAPLVAAHTGDTAGWVVAAPQSQARGLFGLAPAPFVQGDFVAALRIGPTAWVTVQPRPEPFPNTWQRRILTWFALAFALVAPLGWMFARRLARPLAQFAAAAERLGRDPTSASAPLHGPAEIGRAAEAFNAMQSRLQRFVEDRTAMMGAISHDLRTPLARMRFRVERAPASLREEMLNDIGQMENMISSVLAFIRDASEPSARERVDLRSIAECVVDDAELVGGDVTLEPGEPITVEADTLAIQRVLANLVDNALKYGSRGEVTMRLQGDEVVTEVADDGPGLPEAELERVFLPFYRSEQARTLNKGGMGLGLAVCRSIARAHGGDVRLLRGEHGLIAQLRLPAAARSDPAQTPKPIGLSQPARKELLAQA